MVDPSSRRFSIHAGTEAGFHQHATTFPTTGGRWRQPQLLGDRLVRSRAISSHTSATIRPSTRSGGLGADSLGRRLVPISAQHHLGPAIRRPSCFAYLSHPNTVVGEDSRCLGVAQRHFLRQCRLTSLSSLREYFGLVYTPQMLSSSLEVPNPVEDKAVRVAAPTSKADDEVPPAKILPGRPDRVSYVCRSS